MARTAAVAATSAGLIGPPPVPRARCRAGLRLPIERGPSATGDDRRPPGPGWPTRSRLIEADLQRSADTHLLRFPLPVADLGIDLYLKDEGTHVTGSLKHRLARSLFLYALCNGWLDRGRPSSKRPRVDGGVRGVLRPDDRAAVRRGDAAQHLAGEDRADRGPGRPVPPGGRPGRVSPRPGWLAASGGHFMDQFTYAERATDWRGNNNIAESIFAQLALERHPVPAWVVVGAGTGGTSATIGRYIRYRRLAHQALRRRPGGLGVLPGLVSGDPTVRTNVGLADRGDRPAVRGAVVPAGGGGPDVRVPDAASLAAMRALGGAGRRVGGSTGTNLWGAFGTDRRRCGGRRQRGSVVTLICDAGERYGGTYYGDEWLAAAGWTCRRTWRSSNVSWPASGRRRKPTDRYADTAALVAPAPAVGRYGALRVRTGVRGSRGGAPHVRRAPGSAARSPRGRSPARR